VPNNELFEVEYEFLSSVTILRGPKRDEDVVRWRPDEEAFSDLHSLFCVTSSTTTTSLEAAESAALTSGVTATVSTEAPDDMTRSTVALMSSASSPALRRMTGGTPPCEKRARS